MSVSLNLSSYFQRAGSRKGVETIAGKCPGFSNDLWLGLRKTNKQNCKLKIII